MAEISRLENQLSLLTEQLAQLNTTTKEQFKQSKLGANYNPFSSAYAAPAYSPSMSLDGGGESPLRLDKVKGKFNPFSHNRIDGPIASTSNLLYVSPQDRIRSDTNQVSSAGRKVMGFAEAGSGLLGVSAGSAAGQIVGAGLAAKIGGWTGATLGTLLPGAGLFVGGAAGAALGAGAFKAVAGTNQRVAANSVHKYMMENSFRFMNPNQSAGTNNPLGAGFGYKDSRELSRGIALMTDDTNLNVKTLMDLTKNFSEGDLMKGVNSTKDFTKRFKGLTETAKTMAYLLNDSVEDAGKFMSDLQLRGFDMSKLTNQTAKMKNLSQFLGKDVAEVAQTAIGHASSSVAGTNMDFTVALGNQTYSTQMMNAINDSFLKEGNKSYEAGYNLIKNMNGPEDAAGVFGKMMNGALLQENNMMEAAQMAATVYDQETDTFSIDSRKLERFLSKGYTVNEAQDAGQKELYNEFVSKKRRKDPTFEASPDLVFNEYFANKQSIVGSMDSKDQLSIIRNLIESVRREAPDKMEGMSDKAVLKNYGFDETSAEMIAAAIRVSKDGSLNQYENRGLTAEYTAKQKANSIGLVGEVKRFGAGVGNAVAGVGMAITAPFQNMADKAIKQGSDFLFGNKDFNYETEFGRDTDTVKKLFGDEKGYVDPSKMGEDFYEEFEKGLRDAQKKGTVVSKLLLNEVTTMAGSVVKSTSASKIMSGEDYQVQRWTSQEGLGDYAKKNYNEIQQTAVKNQISDQMLGYIGKTKNMNQDQLDASAPELKRLMEAYGGNEILAIAAYERGQEALDKSLAEIAGDGLTKARESKDFTDFNSNPDIAEWSKAYVKDMEKTAGTSVTEWQGLASTIQSKSQSAIADPKKSSPKDLLMGAIELTSAGLPKATGETILDARLTAAGVKVTPEMSQSEKEALLSVAEGAYENNIKNLESYTKSGSNKELLNLTKEEREKTINAYLSQTAGKDKLSSAEQTMFNSVKSNYTNIVEGKSITGNSFGLYGVHLSEMNDVAASSNYGDMNSASLKEIMDEAIAMDEAAYMQVEGAQKHATTAVSALNFEGKNAEQTSDARQEIMKALRSSDLTKLESLGKEYMIDEHSMEELRGLAGAKLTGSDINPLTLDLEKTKGEHAAKAQVLASQVRWNYKGAQSVLDKLGFTDEQIKAKSIGDDKLETTGVQAVEASRQALIDLGASGVAALNKADLTNLMNSGLFTEEEMYALSNEDGSGRNVLKANEDGTFSFSKNPSIEDARRIIEYASEEYDLGSNNTEQKDKEKEGAAKTGINTATTDLLTTVENTTQVMIDSTRIMMEGMTTIANMTGVQLPTTASGGAGATYVKPS